MSGEFREVALEVIKRKIRLERAIELAVGVASLKNFYLSPGPKLLDLCLGKCNNGEPKHPVTAHLQKLAALRSTEHEQGK